MEPSPLEPLESPLESLREPSAPAAGELSSDLTQIMGVGSERSVPPVQSRSGVGPQHGDLTNDGLSDSRVRRRWRAAGRAGLLLVFAAGILLNISEVSGRSMEPGIHDRDHIVVDQLTYMVGEVSRGDVVVLRYPLDPSLDYIKRVIGLPGDDIVIARGKVIVNGQTVDEPYVAPRSVEPWTLLHTTVRPGHYFVLGDNRRRSSDSREFGQVPFENLRGKVRFRFWPLSRLGTVN